MYIKLKLRVGFPTDDTEYDGGTVCEGHTESFESLANRPPAERGFLIVRKVEVGAIETLEGGASVNKEI